MSKKNMTIEELDLFHEEVKKSYAYVETLQQYIGQFEYLNTWRVRVIQDLKYREVAIKMTAEELYDELDFVLMERQNPNWTRKDYEKYKSKRWLLDKLFKGEDKDAIEKIRKEIAFVKHHTDKK